MPLDLVVLAERLDGERPAGACEAAGRAGRGSRPRRSRPRTPGPAADEDRSPRCGSARRSPRASSTSIDRCSGRVAVDEVDAGGEVRRRATIRPWSASARARMSRRDGGGEAGGGPRPRRRRRTPRSGVTRRAGESGPCSAWVIEVGGDGARVRGASASTRPSDGPAGQVDADLADELELRGGHPGAARVRRRGRRARGPRPGGRRRARRSPGRRPRRAGRRRRAGRPRRAGPGGRLRRASAGLATTTVPTPATRAGTTVMTSEDGYGRRPARDVDAGAVDGEPAPLDLDAVDDRRPGRRPAAGTPRTGGRSRSRSRAPRAAGVERGRSAAACSSSRVEERAGRRAARRRSAPRRRGRRRRRARGRRRGSPRAASRTAGSGTAPRRNRASRSRIVAASGSAGRGAGA